MLSKTLLDLLAWMSLVEAKIEECMAKKYSGSGIASACAARPDDI